MISKNPIKKKILIVLLLIMPFLYLKSGYAVEPPGEKRERIDASGLTPFQPVQRAVAVGAENNNRIENPAGEIPPGRAANEFINAGLQYLLAFLGTPNYTNSTQGRKAEFNNIFGEAVWLGWHDVGSPSGGPQFKIMVSFTDLWGAYSFMLTDEHGVIDNAMVNAAINEIATQVLNPCMIVSVNTGNGSETLDLSKPEGLARFKELLINSICGTDPRPTFRQTYLPAVQK